ncbi:MAG: hypothetical protein H6708_31350 [Kofleriaceae bacterium]|nr:hypothetical protein [Kofleriaceae bacterium]
MAIGGVLSAVPLRPAEVEALAPGPGALIVGRDGEAVVVPPGGAEPVDPAAWLDLGAVEIAEVAALAAPPAAAVAAPAVDVRAALGVGAARGELTRGGPGPGAGAVGERTEDGGVADGVAGGAAGRVAATAGRAWGRGQDVRCAGRRPSRGVGAAAPVARGGGRRRALPPGAGRGAGGATALAPAAVTGTVARRGRGLAASGLAPPRRGLVDRLQARLALALWKSSLGRAIGRRHAAYLRETLELFDRGDLDEALRRRAVPLGGGGGGPSELALGLPARRDALTPSMAGAGGGAAIPVALDAIRLLRDRYEAARQRLLREGRVEEAAFVVADLLVDPAAAVALLERHGRAWLAAELAEARGLDPALVVRQWFLAGEPARAAQLAWRTGTFADAVARAHREPALALALRAAGCGRARSPRPAATPPRSTSCAGSSPAPTRCRRGSRWASPAAGSRRRGCRSCAPSSSRRASPTPATPRSRCSSASTTRASPSASPPRPR